MPTKKTESELIHALAGVFRSHGYEGASMARISQATGLQKSSLYHRFPEGKQQMAAAVAAAIADGVQQLVAGQLNTKGTPRSRVRKAAEQLAAFYEDGRRPCAMDTLSVAGDQGEQTLQELRRSYDALITGFTDIAIEAGAKPKAARERATRAVVLIQGALVVGRVTDDTQAFHRVLEELPALLCG